MSPEIALKLEHAEDRYEEIGLLLSDPDVMADQNRFRDLSKEYAQIEPLVLNFRSYQAAQQELDEAEEMLADEEMADLAKETIKETEQLLQRLDAELKILLIPKDPNDDNNIYLEVRAGTGGDEAAIFAGDLFRMYSRYAEKQGWKVSVVSVNEGEHGGFKEIIALVKGHGAFSKFKFESGTHRVQRVPETESQGRVHTSACTVAVLPEVDSVDAIDINPSDLRIDTFRSSGAGGQHVNTTDSAVRITHIPTNTVVECQDERSQHKNKAKAMSLLSAKILDAEQAKVKAEQSEARKLQVGSGDRSQRIRTYNYPQGRISDHRINLTLYKLNEIIDGDLDWVIEPLTQESQAELLTQINQ
ncbi:peptide chain release factor 1 [Marinicella sp. S1101]|uniref:peptide chain release factor 1 n=1 Tax=Marinicella marina TaxID=2996016 RepID=UPI002260D654|nr:peptide chain release factor 1 [Marinicella marina]MCX7554128.1 peptide chain release factor 1 [Marinicella marina]MDJ1141179.1 peptide chain release factor 1 [Marinicella marina]